MNPHYTKEQLDDINERVKEANENLKKLQLSSAANIKPFLLPSTMGENVFAFQVTPVFADLKYGEKPQETIEEAEVKEVK